MGPGVQLGSLLPPESPVHIAQADSHPLITNLRVLFQFAEQQRDKVRTVYLISGWSKVWHTDTAITLLGRGTGLHAQLPAAGYNGTPWLCLTAWYLDCLQDSTPAHVHRLVEADQLQGGCVLRDTSLTRRQLLPTCAFGR